MPRAGSDGEVYYDSGESVKPLDGLPVSAAGVEGCGPGLPAVKCRDSSALTLTIVVMELSNVLAVVGTVSYRAVVYWNCEMMVFS